MGDSGVHSGVELHLAVKENLGILEFLTDGLHEVDSVIMTTAAKGRERKQGNARRFGEEFASGSVGLMDDFYELVFVGVFAGGHVGEEVDFVVALHDGKARKGVAREAEVFLASENHIARGIINASNHGIGLAGFDHGASGSEIWGF